MSPHNPSSQGGALAFSLSSTVLAKHPVGPAPVVSQSQVLTDPLCSPTPCLQPSVSFRQAAGKKGDIGVPYTSPSTWAPMSPGPAPAPHHKAPHYVHKIWTQSPGEHMISDTAPQIATLAPAHYSSVTRGRHPATWTLAWTPTPQAGAGVCSLLLVG